MRHLFKSKALLGAGVTMAVLAACAAQQPIEHAWHSTKGATLVRAGTVIAVRPLAQATPPSDQASAGRTESAAPARQRIDVKFEDGSVGAYETDAGDGFLLGERILVSKTRGDIRLSR